jgi:hypothetical protein
MANFNRSNLKIQTGNNIPNNTSEAITPAIDRGDRDNYADSLVSRLDDPYSKYLGTTGGISTALTLTSSLDYSSTAYDGNMVVFFQMNVASGASPTVNINAIGALPIYDDQQNQITDAGNLISGRYYAGVFNTSADGAGTDGFVIILRFGSTPANVVVTRDNTATPAIGSAGKYVLYGTTAAASDLPAGSTDLVGKDYGFYNTSTATWTISGDGTDTIANSDPFVIYPGASYGAFWDGTTWIFE